jgi:hypothetical protein
MIKDLRQTREGIDFSMTKKEIVKRAVHMQNPSETPLFFENRDQDKSYLVWTGYTGDPAFVPGTQGENEWGIVWRTLNETLGQPDFCPLEESWDLFEHFKAPDPHVKERYAYIQPVLDKNPDRYVVANLGITGFNMATFMRGFANFLEDLYIEPEKANALLDMIFGFEEEVISLLDQGVVGRLAPASRFSKVVGQVVAAEQAFAESQAASTAPSENGELDQEELASHGTLLGEWLEWTPTSAIDMDVTLRDLL